MSMHRVVAPGTLISVALPLFVIKAFRHRQRATRGRWNGPRKCSVPRFDEFRLGSKFSQGTRGEGLILSFALSANNFTY